MVRADWVRLGSGLGLFSLFKVSDRSVGTGLVWVGGGGIAGEASFVRSFFGNTDGTSGFCFWLNELLDMATLSGGVPSMRSGWLDAFRVIRNADPGGMETFISDKLKSTEEVEVFGRLIRMVFFPDELEP